jgi:hypothetical protein
MITQTVTGKVYSKTNNSNSYYVYLDNEICPFLIRSDKQLQNDKRYSFEISYSNFSGTILKLIP